MFKIFIVIFLATGGSPVGKSASHFTEPTLEACQAHLTSEDVTDPKSLAAAKQAFEQQVGAEVKLAAVCAEVGEDGNPVNLDQVKSDLGISDE